MELHWKPVPGALLYSISAQPDISGFPKIITSDSEMILIENLESNLKYEFELVTSVDFGRTDPSYGKQRTVRMPPMLNLDNIRSSWFDISWSDNEYCEEYKVTLNPPTGQIYHDRNVVKIQDAQPGTDYQVSVICIVRQQGLTLVFTHSIIPSKTFTIM